MYIKSGVIWSRLVDADGATLSSLEDRFKVKVPGAQFSPSVRAGHWDGYARFFKPAGQFMTGFLAEVLLHMRGDLGLAVSVEKTYQVPKPGKPLVAVEPFTPRAYQEEIAAEAIQARRGVIKAATNAGKTEIAMMIIQRLGLPALYTVVEQTLWAQTYDRFVARFGGKVVGRIGAGVWDPKLVTIAMVQSVVPKLVTFAGKQSVFAKSMPHAPMVLIPDEVHMFSGVKKRRKKSDADLDSSWASPYRPMARKPQSQWMLLLEKVQAPYRFGMSGTPLTEEETRDRNLVGLTGPMIGEVTNRELVDMGFSAVPKITFVRYEGLHRKMGWDEAYRRLIVESEPRNAAIADLCWVHKGKQVLILCNWAEHALRIKRTLNQADVSCVFLSGRDDVFTRQRWLKEFAAGRIRVIVATTIFDQGIDAPAIDVLIMAGGMGMSPVKPLQRLGRGLRKRPDKDEVIVYDFEDRYQEDTEKHSERRLSLFRQEQFVVRTRTVEQLKEEYRG